MKPDHALLAAAFAACALVASASAASLDEGVKAFRAHDLDEAVRLLKPFADLGDPDAAWYLGSIYNDDADRKHRDDNRAFMLLSRAARAGNPMATAAVYKMRTKGKVSFLFEMYGLNQEQIAALAPLRKAAESGIDDAISLEDLTRLAVATCENMGRHTSAGPADTLQDNQPALEWLKRAAQSGQPQAQFLIGMAYLGRQPCYVARPFAPDVIEAQKWLRLASSRGIVGAQVMAARLDMQPPPGLVPDVKASLAGLRDAASRGYPPALAVLAEFTSRGIGMPADPIEADRLREKASALGDPSATWALVAARSGKGASNEDLLQAFAWLGQCAEAGDPHCQYELAMRHIQGRGTRPDKAQFFKWLKVAANNCDSTAATHLGQTLLFDTGSDRDVKGGLAYLREGVSHGHPVAMGRLADEYRTGEHLPQDLAKAWALYRLAAQRGDGQSQDVLDQMRPQLRPAQIERGEQLAKAWTPDRRVPGDWEWRALGVRSGNPADSF